MKNRKPIFTDFYKGMIAGFCVMTICMFFFIDHMELHIPKFCERYIEATDDSK